MDQIVKEGIEIQLHAKNANKEASFMLSLTWQPVYWNAAHNQE
jgi:hypothetical protein